MRILLAGSLISNEPDDDKRLCRLLEEELRRCGHTVDLFFLPYSRNVLTVLDQMAAYSLLHLEQAELLITVGFPACLLSFPRKICYLTQTEPMLWEYWDSPYGVLADRRYSDIRYAVEKNIIHSLREAKVFCGSGLLQSDLATYGIKSDLLRTPALRRDDGGRETGYYYMLETGLQPWEQAERAFSANTDDHEVRIYIPEAATFAMERLHQLLTAKKEHERFRIIPRRASYAELRGADAMMYFGRETRKIPDYLVCGAQLEKNLLYFENIGATEELLLTQGSQISRDEMNVEKMSCKKCISPEEFARRIIA